MKVAIGPLSRDLIGEALRIVQTGYSAPAPGEAGDGWARQQMLYYARAQALALTAIAVMMHGDLES